MSREIERTEDRHHVVIDGRRWRATDPSVPEDAQAVFRKELMSARRAVGAALKADDSAADQAARPWSRPPGSRSASGVPSGGPSLTPTASPGDGRHEQVAADERALPGRPAPAEDDEQRRHR